MSDTDLRSLYQEVLLDHYKRPRNFGTLDSPTGRGEGNNPLCGDRLTVEVAVADDRVDRIAFRGSGCAISTASASLMSEAVAGHTVQEARALSERFRAALTGPAVVDTEALGKLVALAGVKEFPMRVKCATLAWHALAAALAGGGLVSTE